MKEYNIYIKGKPIAKKRPRFARRGKHVTTYNDQETEEGRTFLQIMQQYKDKPIRRPVHITMVFNILRPKSHFGTGKNENKVKDSAPLFPVTKPDVDNYIKFYLDVMNEHVYLDDSQVTSVAAAKSYNLEAFTLITIRIID